MTTTRKPRLGVSSATIVLFFASFLTHDAGDLLHSLVSLVFTFVLFFHLRNNWRVYFSSARNLTKKLKWKIKWKGLLDTGQLLLVVAVTVSGVSLWIGGDGWELGHETTGAVVTVLGVAHIATHYQSLKRLIQRPRATG